MKHRHLDGSVISAPATRAPMPLLDRPALKACDGGLRLLSLDFDGVLHPTRLSHTGMNLFEWLPVLVDVLAPHPDVSVLVHSSWRYQYSLDELRDILGALAPRFVGIAPLGPRYEGILAWLAMSPRFTSYRILDDDADAFPTPPPAQLILCKSGLGINDVRVLAALTTWLERRTP